jgi:hypothetical protein
MPEKITQDPSSYSLSAHKPVREAPTKTVVHERNSRNKFRNPELEAKTAEIEEEFNKLLSQRPLPA